jgi:act minimal PKS acyl carrier protein
MSELTLDQLRTIMRELGVEDGVDLDGEILDASLLDLGYDSLAVLQMATVVGRQTGVTIEDSDVTLMRTPREVLDYVRDRQAVAS